MRKNSVRILAVVMAVVMLVSQVVMPASATEVTIGDDFCTVCGFDAVRGAFIEMIKEPTCGNVGYAKHECENEVEGVNCDGVIAVQVPATGTHVSDGNKVDAVAATCTTPGAKAYERCVECNAYLEPDDGDDTTDPVVIADIVIPALGHNYVGTTTDPTCTDEGYTTYVCSVCGDTYVGDKVACPGHTFVDKPGQEANCFDKGFTPYKECSVCGYIEGKEEIDVQDHQVYLFEEVVPTSCEANGYKIFKCKQAGCKYENGRKEVVKIEHKAVRVKAKDATCTEDGWSAHQVCEVCGLKSTDYVLYPKKDHSLQYVAYLDPTCTEEGYTDAVVCANGCGLKFVNGDVLPATGHNFGAWTVTEPATCTTAGSQSKTCAVCQEVVTEEIHATGHRNLIEMAAVQPTCNSTGFRAAIGCTDCNKAFELDVSRDPAVNYTVVGKEYNSFDTFKLRKAHVYKEINVAPTCTTAGYIVYTCTVENCANANENGGYTYSEVTAPALGHTPVEDKAVDPTCEDKGLTKGSHCSVCNAVLEAQQEIPELGHKEQDVEKLDPTYDADGHTAGKVCTVCGKATENATKLDELKEGVKFYYVVKGVNGADKGVNSGYVTVEIYFDVLKAANDEYESDVLANIYAVNYKFNYDKDVFSLTDVTVAPGAFAGAAFTKCATANANGELFVTQDMMNGSKVFRGKNLYATLTFQVADEIARYGDYGFTGSVENLLHTDATETFDIVNEADVDFEVVKVGDANADGKYDAADTYKLMTYFNAEDKEYNTVYDMDKDGDVDFVDFGLLRQGIVGNEEEFLSIEVNPNAKTDAEV